MKIYSVKSARKDYPDENIEKGKPYWWCTPKKAGVKIVRRNSIKLLETWITNYAKSFRGEFGSNMENWEERKETISTQEEKDELIDEIQNFLDEKNSSLENLPYQLQENHVLNEQIEELETLLSEIEDIEIEDEEDE